MIVCKRLLSAFLTVERPKNPGKTGSLADLSADCRVFVQSRRPQRSSYIEGLENYRCDGSDKRVSFRNKIEAPFYQCLMKSGKLIMRSS